MTEYNLQVLSVPIPIYNLWFCVTVVSVCQDFDFMICMIVENAFRYTLCFKI